jgi:hypothetical protein
MALAKQSRTNVSAMTGQAGALQVWLNYYASDAEAVRSLTVQLPSEDDNYEALKPAALADKVVTLHRLRLLSVLRIGKYILRTSRGELAGYSPQGVGLPIYSASCEIVKAWTFLQELTNAAICP